MSIGAYRPCQVVTNADICATIDSTDEWIRERSGIESRRMAPPDVSMIDMAVAAGRDALTRSGVPAEEIGAVLLATSTHLRPTPSAAAVVAHRAGVTPAAAMDVAAGCAGFCHAIALGSDMVKGGTARHVLVIGAEKLSLFLDPTDRSTAFLFADGAGAAVIGPSDSPQIGPTVWGSDGSQADVITTRTSWMQYREEPGASWPFVTMQGQSVFRWAVFAMAKAAQSALDAAGVSATDLTAFVPHQANLRIIEALGKKLGLPGHVVIARDVVTAGNTSAASVPLAIDALLTGQAAGGPQVSGGIALLIGFGAGLSYAAQVVELP
jgi:3-oxoacyl-[acyl-carrier-protein] synthase III